MPTKYTFAYAISTLKKNEAIQVILSTWTDLQDQSSWIKHGFCPSKSNDGKPSFSFFVITNSKLSIGQIDEIISLLTNSGATHATILIAPHPAK